MSDRGIKIRFVGGQWHNELKTVERRPYMHVAVPSVKLSFYSKQPAKFEPSYYRSETYHLLRFYTEYKTIFEQYVHESLMSKGDPAPETYSENLPTMEFDPMPLILALAGKRRR